MLLRGVTVGLKRRPARTLPADVRECQWVLRPAAAAKELATLTPECEENLRYACA